MILHIDSKDQKVIKVVLKDKGKVVGSLSEENQYGSQVLLPLIVKLLKQHQTKGVKLTHPKDVLWEMLDAIEVETGAGSFTGLRIGVSVANALAFALKIPINNKRMETELKY